MSAVIQAGLPMRRADNRAFNYAVLFSLLLHGALLFSFSMRPAKSPPASPGPIVARLQPLAKPAAAPQPVQPEPPKPRVEEPTPPPPPQVKPVPQPKPSPLARPPEPKAAKPPTEAKPQPAPAPPQPAPPVAAPAPSAPAAPGPVVRTDPAPSAPAQDSGTLDTYRMDLMRMARNYKRYPRVAMDNNWEGRVVVRMVIGANGMISTITVVTSAGHEILDKQALDMIQKAKPRVQIPPALRGKEFVLEIPVIYSLKDADAG